MTTRQVSLTLDEDLVARLKTEADRRGLSLSAHVNRTLTEAQIVRALDEHFEVKRQVGLLDETVEAARLTDLRTASERLARAE